MVTKSGTYCLAVAILAYLLNITAAISLASRKDINRDLITKHSDKVLGFEFFVIKLIVLHSQGRTGVQELSESAKWALWFVAKNKILRKGSVLNRYKFDRLYKKHVIAPCDLLTHLFKQHERLAIEMSKEADSYKERFFVRMAYACRTLTDKSTKKATFKLVNKDPLYTDDRPCNEIAMADLEKSLAAGFESLQVNELRNFELDTGLPKHSTNGPNNVTPIGGISLRDNQRPADATPGDDGHIQIEPSKFAMSNTDETHDPDFDYEGDDYLVVGKKPVRPDA